MTISVISAKRSRNGTITITGAEFTKTTTVVYIDDVAMPFEWVSAEKIKVSGASKDATSVEIEKGGSTETIEITDKEDPAMSKTKEVEPTVETPEVDPQAIAAGTWPSPIDGFRAAVAGVPLVGLIPVGDEKTPYPTGTPLGAGKAFWLKHGYYKSATPT